MANPRHVAKLDEGVEAWNRWRIENPTVRPELDGADLADRILWRANLSGAHLREAKLRGADLELANLGASTFASSPDHRGLWFPTYLDGADLSGSDLSQAVIIATLSDADLSGAVCAYTRFVDVHDLHRAKGLDMIEFEGTCSLGLDTLLRAEGQLPDAFLRACGYDPIIQKVLVGDREALTEAAYRAAESAPSFRLQSCFISSASVDREFVALLQARLNASGVDYWHAPEHGRWGRGIAEQIDHEIAVRDRVVLVCSEASLGQSDWVRWEIERAIAQEKLRGRRVIFPIVIDDALSGWNDPRASRLMEVLAADFRGATTAGASFDERFSRLLQGLTDGPAVRGEP